SPHWRGIEGRRGRLLVRFVPWIAAGLAACVLLAAFTWFHARLNEQAAPIGAEAARIALEPVPPPGDAPRIAPRLSLAQLLSNESQAGLLEVEERADGQARVRLSAGTMFASGGETLGSDAQALVRRVADALDQLAARLAPLQGQLRAVDRARARRGRPAGRVARRRRPHRRGRCGRLAAAGHAGVAAAEPGAQPARRDPVPAGGLKAMRKAVEIMKS